MAKVKRKYTPIGDEWIPANEAVAQLARYHASRTKRLFAYDGDGLAELQLAIQCGYATCGLLCRSDGTQERVGPPYLRHDPAQLAVGYDRERRAIIYLRRDEIKKLVDDSAEQQLPTSEPPAVADTPVNRQAAAANLSTKEWIKYVWPREAKALSEAKDRTGQSRYLARQMLAAKDREGGPYDKHSPCSAHARSHRGEP